MTNNEYDKFVDLMQKLKKNFNGDVTTKKIQFYFNELKKYKYSSVERGVDHLINKRPYHTFPIIGEIVNAIKESKFNNFNI